MQNREYNFKTNARGRGGPEGVQEVHPHSPRFRRAPKFLTLHSLYRLYMLWTTITKLALSANGDSLLNFTRGSFSCIFLRKKKNSIQQRQMFQKQGLVWLKNL